MEENTVFSMKQYLTTGLWGYPVLVAKAAGPSRGNTGAIKSRLGSSYGTSQDRNGIDHTDTRRNGDPYISGKHSFPALRMSCLLECSVSHIHLGMQNIPILLHAYYFCL